jgi:hypothetical protein
MPRAAENFTFRERKEQFDDDSDCRVEMNLPKYFLPIAILMLIIIVITLVVSLWKRRNERGRSSESTAQVAGSEDMSDFMLMGLLGV